MSLSFKMVEMKKKIDKCTSSKEKLNLMFCWIKTNHINTHEFSELLNYCHLGISNSAKSNGKINYIGNEDPESIMG